MYWAQKHVDTGNPLYAVPGMFASLWTPSTAGDTALTLSGEGLFAIGAKVLQGIKGLRTTGALAGDVASTFRFGRYSEVTLAESKTLTRFYDNTNAFAKGRYMTDASSLSSSTFLNRMGLALRPSWNGMTKQAHWTVPAGSTIYKGKAATQFPWIGGKTQYFVPNISNVKRVSGN